MAPTAFLSSYREATIPIGLGTLLLAACASSKPASRGLQPATATVSPVTREAPARSDAPSRASAMLSDAVRTCRRVQNDRRLPIRCDVDYLDGVPAMMIGFLSPENLDAMRSEVARYLVVPFCTAVNEAGARAAVVLAIEDVSAHTLDCATGEVVRSVRLEGEQREDTFDRAVRVCEAMRSSNVPMTCSMAMVGETPSVIFGFSSAQDMNAYFERAAEVIALPFCEAANAASEVAGVFVTVGASARGLRCDGGGWSEWTSLRRRSAPSAPAPAAPSGRRRRSMTIAYDLLSDATPRR